jgi:hypothetical protein
MKLPTEVNILGKHYSIIYVDNPADVDPRKRESLWGHIDYWTRTIRIYVNEIPIEDVWHTILHEVLHAIGKALHLEVLYKTEDEETVDLLALALTDVLIRNGWLLDARERP